MPLMFHCYTQLFTLTSRNPRKKSLPPFSEGFVTFCCLYSLSASLEPISKQPVLTVSSTWHTSTKSCTVLLECSATSDGSVTYSWTVRDQTRSGSGLQYIIRPQDGDTTFTCTIYSLDSEKSASITVRCSGDTRQPGMCREEKILIANNNFYVYRLTQCVRSENIVYI